MAKQIKIRSKAAESPSGNSRSQIRDPEPLQATHSPVERLLRLQKIFGNQHARLLVSSRIQAKLRLGTPQDRYEQEADLVAERVMRMPEPAKSPPIVEENDEVVRRQQASPQSPRLSQDLESRIQDLRTGGEPLSGVARDFFEPRFGYDFSQVRIHSDSRAAEAAGSLYARAFTVGKHVIFNSGEYAPHSSGGKRLLAHELTHTIQQQGSTRAFRNHRRSRDSGRPLEIAPLVTPLLQCLRARGLVSRELREIQRQARWLRPQIDRLEGDRAITTEEAERYRDRLDALDREARALVRHRNTTRADARRIWRRGRRILRSSRRARDWVRWRRQIATRGRSTRGLRLISQFLVRPPVIRIHQGEAARISFILRQPARSISWFILSREVGEPTSYRFFRTRNTSPGYKYALWNGTWEGLRNRAPQSGTYRVHLSVTDRRGRTEDVFDQIRVENPQNLVVHPRHGSGYALTALTFNGRTAVLSDSQGNTIQMRAVSGLKRHHRLNPRRIDYTQARYQWVPNRGPLPVGTYTIRRGTVQHPQLRRGALRYPPRWASARAWGAIRVPLSPNTRRRGPVVRSEFFVHLDVSNDGTAGCIGIHPGDEGKFNNMMSLLGRMPNDLPVSVRY